MCLIFFPFTPAPDFPTLAHMSVPCRPRLPLINTAWNRRWRTSTELNFDLLQIFGDKVEYNHSQKSFQNKKLSIINCNKALWPEAVVRTSHCILTWNPLLVIRISILNLYLMTKLKPGENGSLIALRVSGWGCRFAYSSHSGPTAAMGQGRVVSNDQRSNQDCFCTHSVVIS